MTETAEELREALQAIREALDIPHAGNAGDEEIRDRILVARAGHAVVMLNTIFGDDATVDIHWSITYLRERLAESPAAGYRTWAGRVAELGIPKGSWA